MAGFNTKIKYKGTSFHIQTQDMGSKANHIESLIYKSGKLLSSRKTPYTLLLSSSDFKEQINQLMKDQHRTIINEISDGKFDHYLNHTEKQKVSHEEPLSTTPSQEKPKTESSENLKLQLVQFSIPSSSDPLSFSLEVKKNLPPKTVPFLRITVQVITELGKEFLLFRGRTDEEGKMTLGLPLPQFPEKRFMLSIKAEKEGLKPAEIKISLKKD